MLPEEAKEATQTGGQGADKVIAKAYGRIGAAFFRMVRPPVPLHYPLPLCAMVPPSPGALGTRGVTVVRRASSRVPSTRSRCRYGRMATTTSCAVK